MDLSVKFYELEFLKNFTEILRINGSGKGHISRYCELEKSAGILSEFEIHLKCMELMKASEKSLLELTVTRAKAQGGEHHL